MSLEKLSDGLSALKALGAPAIDADLIAFVDGLSGLSGTAAAKAITSAASRTPSGSGGLSAEEAADRLDTVATLLSTVSAAKGVQAAATALRDSLRTAKGASLEGIRAAIREAEDAKRTAAARKAEAAAKKADAQRVAQERVEAYVQRLRTAEPERGALFGIMDEMKRAGRDLSAADWKTIAQRLSGGSGSSKAEAQKRVMGWIATQVQSTDARRAVDRLHKMSA